MQMLTSLLGSLKSVFSTTFLFAGLLPSAVIVFGWQWYKGGDVQEVLKDLLSGDNPAVASSIVIAVAICVFGLVFYAMRIPVLKFFRTLPTRILLPIHNALRQKHIRARNAAEQERQKMLWLRTVVTWHEKDFHTPNYLPPTESLRDRQDVMQASEKARLQVLEYAPGPDEESSPTPPKETIDLITDGLRALFAYDRNHAEEDDCLREIDEWRKLCRLPEKRRILELIKVDVTRRWRREYRKVKQFPEEDIIQPTALGNRLAAMDTYAAERYGIDTSTLWTRLWGVLEKEQRKPVETARLGVEVLLNLCVSFLCLALAILFGELASVANLMWHSKEFAESLLSIVVLAAFVSLLLTCYWKEHLSERFLYVCLAAISVGVALCDLPDIWRAIRRQEMSPDWRVIVLIVAPLSLAVLFRFLRKPSLKEWYLAVVSLIAGLVLFDLSLLVTAVRSGESALNWPALIVALLSVFLSVGCYRGSVFAVQLLEENIVRVVDLHRLELIRKIGFRMPMNVREEREIFKELQGFFSQGWAIDENRAIVPPPKK